MAKNTLAPIAKWTIEHEQIVAMHISQYSNEEIARKTKKTAVRISQILNDPQALQILKEFGLKIRAKMMETTVDGIAALAVMGLKRMKETIEFEDFGLGTDAKKHQDRLSFDLAKLVYTSQDNKTEEAPPLDAASFERLTEAIEASNAADKLIREAQFVEVEEDD